MIHQTTILLRMGYLASPAAAPAGAATGCSAASGWIRSKAGRSLRMRGIDAKLWRGGGQEVAHSSDAPSPHGSSKVPLGALPAVIQTFRKNGSIDAPRMTAPIVETWLPHSQLSYVE